MKVRIVMMVGVMVAGLGCQKASAPQTSQSATDQQILVGTVRVDGSSTVFPITEAVAEEFQKAHRGVRVTVGISGTGGGFKKFVVGEIDINDASRTIQSSEETQAAANGIAYIELPVAFDGISVVVNPKNTFATSLTMDELKRIWQPGSTVKLWSDVRPEWPARELHLYGPGTDSGTFDYFTEAVNGKSQASRADFTASEDDNVLVQGVSGDVDALGYFGYAYYRENRSRLNVVAIDGGNGGVTPSSTTIENGSYPLARPIFIYVAEPAAARPEVETFVQFYLEHATALVGEVGYIALPKDIYALARKRFDLGKTGSVFADAHGKSLSIAERLAQ